jgi:hypothetical protein
MSTRHFTDLGFSAVAAVHSYHVDFAVYAIAGTEVDGTPVYGPSFEKSLDGAEVYLHGFVKWDGCSNWHFDAQDECMLHGCGRRDLTNIGGIMAACWDWTAELLPTFDREVAGS